MERRRRKKSVGGWGGVQEEKGVERRREGKRTSSGVPCELQTRSALHGAGLGAPRPEELKEALTQDPLPEQG